jgi:imidazoleglycerol-phosphate dehydratase
MTARRRTGKNGKTPHEDEPKLPVPIQRASKSGNAPTPRRGTAQRKTKETDIRVAVDLDGQGLVQADTGVRFFDHMLETFAHHSLVDLKIVARGDIDVDPHHTVEDVGLCIGRAILDALGDRVGIFRYGESTRPFDEALISAYVDFCGRPSFVYRVDLLPGRIGTFDVELAEVFFSALAAEARMNLHLLLHYGKNRHHIVEGCFKTLAFAIRQAVQIDARRSKTVASTKGSLD